MSQLRVNTITDAGGTGSTYAPGHVVQVVSVTKTDPFTMSSTTFTDVTGLSLSITPKSANSKILVAVNLSGQGQGGIVAMTARLVRNSTPISVGTGVSGKTAATFGNIVSADASNMVASAATFFDSPNTTSSVIYKMQIATNVNGQTVFINRSSGDIDNAQYARAISTITLMEIAQ
jgi:hypothetical protein